MKGLSTREAARKLGISAIALSRYIAVGKVPTPGVIILGRSKVHVWTGSQIEHVRKLLPKIANGRKTRYQKKQLGISSPRRAPRHAGTGGAGAGTGQQSAKTKKKKK
jgi:hypothetical protein